MTRIILIILLLIICEFSFAQVFEWTKPEKGKYAVEIDLKEPLETCQDFKQLFNKNIIENESVFGRNEIRLKFLKLRESRDNPNILVYKIEIPENTKIKMNIYYWKSMEEEEKQQLTAFYNNFYKHLENHIQYFFETIYNLPTGNLDFGVPLSTLQTDYLKDGKFYVPKEKIEKWKKDMIAYLTSLSKFYDEQTVHGILEEKYNGENIQIPQCCGSYDLRPEVLQEKTVEELIEIAKKKFNIPEKGFNNEKVYQLSKGKNQKLVDYINSIKTKSSLIKAKINSLEEKIPCTEIDIPLALAVTFRENSEIPFSESEKRIISAGRDTHIKGEYGLDFLYSTCRKHFKKMPQFLVDDIKPVKSDPVLNKQYAEDYKVGISSDDRKLLGFGSKEEIYRPRLMKMIKEIERQLESNTNKELQHKRERLKYYYYKDPAILKSKNGMAALICVTHFSYKYNFLSRYNSSKFEFKDFSIEEKENLLNHLSMDGRRFYTQVFFGSGKKQAFKRITEYLKGITKDDWQFSSDCLNLNAIVTNNNLWVSKPKEDKVHKSLARGRITAAEAWIIEQALGGAKAVKHTFCNN